MRKQVILVTDGDSVAKKAIIKACQKKKLYPILESAGNPTPLTGAELVDEIERAPFEPVVVMLDDRGKSGIGIGERAMEYLLQNDHLEILGVVAVASDTDASRGVQVDKSVNNAGKITKGPVDKDGEPEPYGNRYLEGDTAELLSHYPEVKIIGCGDLGKMGGRDNPGRGAKITTKCLEEVLKGTKH